MKAVTGTTIELLP